MKRTAFIIGGIAIICLLIGVWVYFLFFATPGESEGQFANFNFNNTEDPNFVPNPEPVLPDPVVDVATPEGLRQLTTSPVAGFTEVQLTPSSTPEIRYIEAGTGHIYSIDLGSGEEERVSATTIPLTSEGVMTPDGQFVMMRSGSGASSELVVGALSIGSDVLQNFAIPGQIHSFTATADNEFVYTTPSGNTLVARAYNPNDNDVRDLFTIPFRDATIAWGNETAGPHYVYPSATSRLEGFLYSYTDGVATREPVSGFGMSAVGSTDTIIYSEQVAGEYQSFIHDLVVDTVSDAPLALIPEKCAFTSFDSSVGICGITLDDYSHLMPDPWYRGEMVLDDNLWEINTKADSARLLISTKSTTGRQIDMINPQFGFEDTNLYFQNKTDGTLWMYVYNKFISLSD